MAQVLHDKGISRLASPPQVKKGKWYLGFVCRNCSAKIYSLDDPSQGQTLQPIVGKGKFSVACPSCMTDELMFHTSDLKPLIADQDSAPSRAITRHRPSNGARQPITTCYPKAKPSYGPLMIEQRPECAVIIARCVSTFSYVENELALLLATILKVNTPAAVAMFLAIQNSRTQIDVLRAAAEELLTITDLELLNAILNLRNGMEKERNDLVHGLFGSSIAVTNGILWIEAKHSTQHTARVFASDYKDMDQTRVHSNTFVYEPADLETIATKLEWLHTTIGQFRGYVRSDNVSWRTERYRQLCAEPRLAKELFRMREGQKKTSKSPRSRSQRDRPQKS